MRLFKLFGALIMWPQNHADKQLIKCMSRQTRARVVSMSARNDQGIGFFDFHKDVDAEFEPWPKKSVFGKIQERRKKNARSN